MCILLLVLYVTKMTKSEAYININRKKFSLANEW
jgi:hypothetical protein